MRMRRKGDFESNVNTKHTKKSKTKTQKKTQKKHKKNTKKNTKTQKHKPIFLRVESI
jgi:hypothetical protein